VRPSTPLVNPKLEALHYYDLINCSQAIGQWLNYTAGYGEQQFWK
jgi:hypothetical protein